MVEPTHDQFEQWKQTNKPVKMFGQNNAEESKKLQARNHAAWKSNMQFEYTAKDKPKQNHLAELGFTTIVTNKGNDESCQLKSAVSVDIMQRSISNSN